MKAIIAILLLAVAAQAAYDASKLAALVQTGTRAFDAVESVYNLLRDLKTENLNTQVAADTKNQTDERLSAETITGLSNVVSINKANWKNAKAYRESIAGQISDAVKWIDWAHSRLAEIDRRAEQLAEQRCYANALFVRSLKDHTDALNVVHLLKHDISGITTNTPSSLAQINSVADKLAHYSNLFRKDAMTQFVQLTKEGGEAPSRGNTIAEQVLSILDDLEKDLNETLAFLQEQEIAAAFALAQWNSDTQHEAEHLSSEIDRKQALLEKLYIAEPAAVASQAKAQSVVNEAQNALNGAIADLDEKKAFYASETERRNEENAIIDECIHIFKDQVRNLVEGTSLGH